MKPRLQKYKSFKEGDAPEEVQLLPLGDVETSHGTFTVTTDGLGLIVDAWKERDREFGWDYEHQTFAEPPIQAPASGWGTLELRDDGLYCVGMKWTETASAYLLKGEYRYWSPVLGIKNGEVVDIYNSALTNFPATFSQTPLVPFSEKGIVSPGLDEAGPEAKTLLLHLLKASYGQIGELVAEMVWKSVDGWAWVEALYADFVIYRSDARYFKQAYTLKDTTATFDGEPVEVVREWVDVGEGGAETEPLEEEAAKAAELKALKAKLEKEKGVELEALKAELAKEKADNNAKVLLKDASEKITPAMKDTCTWLATEHPGKFETLMAALPAVVPPRRRRGRQSLSEGSPLSGEDLAISKQIGVSAAELQAFRAKRGA